VEYRVWLENQSKNSDINIAFGWCSGKVCWQCHPDCQLASKEYSVAWLSLDADDNALARYLG
jgi:hypothetical protein